MLLHGITVLFISDDVHLGIRICLLGVYMRVFP